MVPSNKPHQASLSVVTPYSDSIIRHRLLCLRSSTSCQGLHTDMTEFGGGHILRIKIYDNARLQTQNHRLVEWMVFHRNIVVCVRVCMFICLCGLGCACSYVYVCACAYCCCCCSYPPELWFPVSDRSIPIEDIALDIRRILTLPLPLLTWAGYSSQLGPPGFHTEYL